jgi:chromosomal replication initiator protein
LALLKSGPLEAVRNILTQSVGPDRYSLWFEGKTRLDLDGVQLRIGVPNLHFQQWMEGRFGKLVVEAARQVLGDRSSASFHIDPELFQTTSQAVKASASQTVPKGIAVHSQGNSTNQEPTSLVGPTTKSQSISATQSAPLREGTVQRPRRKVRRLDHFVTGPANKAAFLAARGFASGEMESPRTLILHGSTGLGKSHLLEGIAHQRRISFPGSKILLQTAEEFANDFLEALRTHKQSPFRKRMRGLDLWLIDDLEGLVGKQKTQEEFATTLDALSRLGATVVVSLQKSPQDTPGIIPELKTRLCGGLVCGLSPMDLPQRRQFLSQLLAQGPKLVVEDGLLDLMARRVRGSGRECEGMVQTLKHHAWATGNPPNESMVRGLSESHQRNDRKVIGVGDIVEAVGHLVGVSSAQMRDKSRSPKPSQARLLAMYFAKELTGATAKEVGAWFGRQHSTILSAHKKIASLEKNDLKVAVGINAWCIRELRQKVQSRLGCDLD